MGTEYLLKDLIPQNGNMRRNIVPSVNTHIIHYSGSMQRGPKPIPGHTYCHSGAYLAGGVPKERPPSHMGNVHLSIGVPIEAHSANTRTCATQASPDNQEAGSKEPQVTPPILGLDPVRYMYSRVSTDQDRGQPHKRAILAPILCATLLCVPIL